METLKIGTSSIRQVPSTWNECRRPHLLALLTELYAPAPDAGVRLRVLGHLTGFQPLLLAGLDSDVLARLLELTDFVFAEEQLLTKQLLPKLRVPGRHRTEPAVTWHGPASHLSNVTFGEFIFAETFFVQHALFRRPEYLDKFLAVLYRPAKRQASPTAADWNGDVRQPFNEHALEYRTKRLSGTLPAIERLAVLTWYRGCRVQLAEEFPDVFAAAEEGTPAAQKAPDWPRVLRKLSGGAFGTVQQTAGQPLRLVLAEMQDAAVEYERLKSQKTSF